MNDRLLEPFDLEARIQREYHNLAAPPAAVVQLRDGPLAGFEKSWASIHADPNLSEQGRLARKAEVRAKTAPALDVWAEQHVAPLDAAITAKEQALAAKLADAPKPNDLQLKALLPRLPQDEAQLQLLYADATPKERAALETLAETVGRLPVQRADGTWAWAPLVDADSVSRHREALLRDADPALTAELEALRRQRGMLRGLLATARAIVRDAR